MTSIEPSTAIAGESAVDKVVAFLADDIRCRRLEPGARLPTEHALARQFDVSRPVVREAIARIKADGLAHSRRGSGLYVAGPLDRRSFKVGDGFAGDTGELLKLLELRLPLEIAMVRLAAARRSEQDLARMNAAQAALMRAEEASDTGIAADLTFHHAIAMASQNSYFADLAAYLGHVLHDAMHALYERGRHPGMRDATVAEHARILRAIEDRDPEAAALAVTMHLGNAREWLIRSNM